MSDIIKNLLVIEQKDGSMWGVPVEIIARNRAEHYKGEFGGDIEHSLAEDTIPLFSNDAPTLICSESAGDREIHDWASNNMNWSDVEPHAVKVMNAPAEALDFQEAWVNGEYSVAPRNEATAVANILDLPMELNDAGATTIRAYLQALLTKLIQDEECFSGKRPFGNSGWMHDLYKPIIKAGLAGGELDEDGNVEDCDDAEVEELILQAIESL